LDKPVGEDGGDAILLVVESVEVDAQAYRAQRQWDAAPQAARQSA
jgi:hypothetical protein